MSDKECRWCKHWQNGYCSKLTEEVSDTDFESNIIELVEDGYLSDFLQENVLNKITEYCKTTGRKKVEKEESAEANANEILYVIETELYGYLLDKLKTKKAELYISPYSEFYCKYWE